MTASTPPLVDVIAGVLAGHTLHYIVPADLDPAPGSKWHVECDCDWTHLADEYRPGEVAHAAHQARAVLAALEQAGGVEWGSRDNDRHRLLWTFDTKEAADKETARHPEHRTTVSRITGPWKRAE